jgi:iron complex outermembrane receptor protein
MPSMRWVGNPTLEPERHDQLEIGWQIDRRRWAMALSVYENRVDDYILRDRFRAPGNNATVYRNVDARLRGGELAGELRSESGWVAGFDLGYVRATNHTEGRPIAQTPPLEGSLRIERKHAATGFGVRLRAAARQTRVDDDPLTGSGLDAGPTAGWSVFDVFASRDLGRSWQLRGGIDNLFDREYAQHLNRSSAFDATQVRVNEPGRAIWLAVTYRNGL